MSNPTVLFLTNRAIHSKNGRYDYKDRIYDNRNNSDSFVRWSGQKKNSKTDNLVLEKEDIHIWYRNKIPKYRYMGKVKKKKLVQPRDNDNILIVDLFIEKDHLEINMETIADIYDYNTNKGHKFQKYKMDCFTKLNLIPIGNWCSGIMEGMYNS
jgi:hypothetical protein